MTVRGEFRRALCLAYSPRLALAARKTVQFKIADRTEAEALSLTVLGARDNGTEFGMASMHLLPKTRNWPTLQNSVSPLGQDW